MTRISDLSSQETGFGIGDRYIQDVISCKYDIEWRALHSWPIYVSYNEDKSLRNKEKWNKKLQWAETSDVRHDKCVSI